VVPVIWHATLTVLQVFLCENPAPSYDAFSRYPIPAMADFGAAFETHKQDPKNPQLVAGSRQGMDYLKGTPGYYAKVSEPRSKLFPKAGTSRLQNISRLYGCNMLVLSFVKTVNRFILGAPLRH